MTPLTPAQLEELLGAYALDAVDDDERREVEQYLSANPRARAEVQQHREVATMLAFTGAPAPDGLWDRIAATIEGQAPAPGPELARVLPIEQRRRRGGWLVAGGIAAAACVAVGVLSYGFIDRGNQLEAARQQVAAAVDLERVFAQAVSDPKARLTSLASDDGTVSARAVLEPTGVGFVAAQGLPALPADRTYQLWGVVPDGDGQKVISLGVMGPRPGITSFSAPATVAALVITEEVAGGVPVSGQPAALAGELS